jgi:isopentenyl-diphosphate Delta-isomerase
MQRKDQFLYDQVVLVDEADTEQGLMAKLEAHEKGLLHRAFSVFIFNSKGQLLLQQRADIKYHSPGLWSNSCCSHPRPGEPVRQAAVRRLSEELGIHCDLYEAFHFIYKSEVDKDLTEHEYDHVFFATTDALPDINKEEVRDWKYMDLQVLAEDISHTPEKYTVWLKIIFDKVFTLRLNERI